MLKECLDVFGKMLDEKVEGLILDDYNPADGSYVIVDSDGTVKEVIEIKMDKKSRELEGKDSEYFNDVRFYDYHSRLISMNKPVDAKKVIHSNNYLSFAIKKESLKNGKLTEAVIDGYYSVLQNPLLKYKKSKEASRIYHLFADEHGQADEQRLNFAKEWIKRHIFNINEVIPAVYEVNLDKKDYLKIFFEADAALYEQEDNRYIMPNIYNNNDYNIEYEGSIYGLPDNNISMNAKKPFLANKTRKSPIPHLLNGKDVLLQRKFFDYLMNQASLGRFNVYVNTDKGNIKAYMDKEEPESVESGCYLRIKKGKELEISAQDNISNYCRTAREFTLKHFVQYSFFKEEYYEDYDKAHSQRTAIGDLLSKILFSNYLKTNYYTEAGDLKINDSVLKLNLLTYRGIIFDWVYKGIDNGFGSKIDRCAIDLLRGSIADGYRDRAVRQLDLCWSLRDYFAKGEDNMAQKAEEIRTSVKEKVLRNEAGSIAGDAEYCYAVGQLAAYFISLSKASKKTQSMVKPFLNASNDLVIKNRLRALYNKYAYAISEGNRRLKNLYGMILAYEPSGIDEDMLILGYMDNNCIYAKTKIED